MIYDFLFFPTLILPLKNVLLELLLLTTLGFFGSFGHCVGMCGPLTASFSLSTKAPISTTTSVHTQTNPQILADYVPSRAKSFLHCKLIDRLPTMCKYFWQTSATSLSISLRGNDICFCKSNGSSLATTKHSADKPKQGNLK